MRRTDDVGNGDPCPVEPSHGRMSVIPGRTDGLQFCYAQSHDMDHTPALYERDGRTPARKRAPGR